jgi:cellulose biosynthesis protein BcsQ
MMKTIAFFNNKSGVGKTTLVYHLAWMFAELGLSVLVADLDPQANLSSMFLDEDTLEAIWTEPQTPRTVVGSLAPLMDGTGDVMMPWMAEIAPGIALVVGDLALSARVEDELSSRWSDCLDRKPIAFRVITSFWRLLAKAAVERQADIVLMDVAPSLGALNRAALIAASHVVIPLVPDLTSIQGLMNLGPTLRGWREGWRERLERVPETLLEEPLPSGAMRSVGYVVYATAVLNNSREGAWGTPDNDPHCLAQLRHYRSLMPLAQEARKPMFHLTPADGALGGHLKAAQDCGKEFRALARALADRCRVLLP